MSFGKLRTTDGQVEPGRFSDFHTFLQKSPEKSDIFGRAGVEGIEPSLEVLETSVLPLNDTPNRGNYSKRLVTKEITGEMSAEIGDVPPMGRRRKIRIRVPYCRIIRA